jgi:ParB-like chromosome segregation protein Spo0J
MQSTDVKPTEKPLSWFKPFPGNPRKDLKPGEPEYESLKRSIQRFGHVQLIVANKDGTVVGGYQTLKILKDIGHEKAKCVILDLDKNDEVALNLALNKITGEWNEPALGEILKYMDENGYDTDITGFNKNEIGELLDRLEMQRVQTEGGTEDDVPDVPKKPETQKGDLWILGEHRRRKWNDIDFMRTE